MTPTTLTTNVRKIPFSRLYRRSPVNLRTKNIWQLRRLARRTARNVDVATRRAAAAGPKQKAHWQAIAFHADMFLGEIRVELMNRKVPVVDHRTTKRIETISPSQPLSTVVFAWKPQRLNNGKWAWLRHIQKVTTNEGVYYTEL